jgi:hypothetical protein
MSVKKTIAGLAIVLFLASIAAFPADFINLATQVAGVLAIANGGLGLSTTPSSPNGVAFVPVTVPSGGVSTGYVLKPAGLVPRFVSGTSDAVVAADRGQCVIYTSASAKAVTIAQAGTTGFDNNFPVCLQNDGAGDLTLTPTTSTITNDSGTAGSTYTLHSGESVKIISDNTNYYSFGHTATLASTASKIHVCMLSVGADNGSALGNADLGPQGQGCWIAAGATINELEVASDGGTPSVIVGRNRAGTIVNIVSSALATGGGGAANVKCANTGGTTGLNGSTTCSATLQNTGLNAGDFLELVSGTAGGTAKRMTIAVTFTAN